MGALAGLCAVLQWEGVSTALHSATRGMAVTHARGGMATWGPREHAGSAASR